MKKFNTALLVAFFGLWVQPAMAYIDPGSGSAIMSAVIGLFMAIGLVVKTFWYKLKGIFIGKKTETELEIKEEKIIIKEILPNDE